MSTHSEFQSTTIRSSASCVVVAKSNARISKRLREKSHPGPKTDDQASKTALGGSKTSPGTSVRAATTSPRSRARARRSAPASSASRRASFPLDRASFRAPLATSPITPPALESDLPSHTLVRRSLNVHLSARVISHRSRSSREHPHTLERSPDHAHDSPDRHHRSSLRASRATTASTRAAIESHQRSHTGELAASVFLLRPRSTHHATACFHCTRDAIRTRIVFMRATSTRPRRVTIVALARSLRFRAPTRAQRSRRGSRPREWGSASQESPTTLAASRLLHARAALSLGDSHATRATAAPARASGTRDATRTLPPSPRHARCTLADALSRADSHATVAPRLPPARVGTGIASDTVPPPDPLDCARRDDVRCFGAPEVVCSRDVHACPIVTIPIVAPSFFLFRPRPTLHAMASFIESAS